MRHPRTASTTTHGGRRLVTLLLLTLAVGITLLPGGSAQAHGSGTPTPADGELLLGTPEKIVVELPGDAPVEISLRRAGGEVIPFTGTVERSPGIVLARPPVLEHGTYVIEWTSAAGDGWSTFSVGKPDASITGTGRPGRPPGATVLGGTLLVLCVLAAASAGRRTGTQRILRRSIAGTGLLAGALLLAPPTTIDAAITFALLLFGGSGAFLLAGGLGERPSGNDSRHTLPLSLVGLLLLPLLVAGAIRRSFGADPFTTVNALAFGAAILLAGVVIPLSATWLLARRRGETGRNRSRLGALATLVVLVAGGVSLPVDARVETFTGETLPAATCLAGTNRLQIQRCLDASLVATARSAGVVEALDTLKRLLTTESRARYFCHEASHAIGRESLRLNGSLADAFRDGYDVCDFGYYHGIVEGAAGGFDDGTFLAAVPTLCEEFASAEELFYMQCNHGIGHAAARRTNNDMVRSLEFCDALAGNPNLTGERLRLAQNGCGTGVTMEWFATATADPNAAVTPKVSRPRDVCLSVPDRWAPECIEYVGNTLDASSPVESLNELGQWCAETAHVEPCYRGLARASAGVGIPARDAISVCDGAVTREARDECVTFYIAAVATTIDYDVSAVDRICRELPEADRSGAFSLCERVRAAVVEVLAAGDGKN